MSRKKGAKENNQNHDKTILPEGRVLLRHWYPQVGLRYAWGGKRGRSVGSDKGKTKKKQKKVIKLDGEKAEKTGKEKENKYPNRVIQIMCRNRSSNLWIKNPRVRS